MSHFNSTLFACLLAALLVVAPLVASATSAGGTAKKAFLSRHRTANSEIMVPEPGAALVFGTGVLVVGVALRRRHRNRG